MIANVIWCGIILPLALLIIYHGGNKPFSVGFVLGIFTWNGMIVFLVLIIASYLAKRIEKVEERIMEQK